MTDFYGEKNQEIGEKNSQLFFSFNFFFNFLSQKFLVVKYQKSEIKQKFRDLFRDLQFEWNEEVLSAKLTKNFN